MASRDYILRIIEMLGQMMAQLRKMLLGGEVTPDAAEGQLQEIAGKAGLDLDFLRSVSLDTLQMLMSPTGEPEPGRCWITAELFLVDALRAEADGQRDEAWDRYERALRLFGLLDPGIIARGFPESAARIEEIRARMSSLAGTDDAG